MIQDLIQLMLSMVDLGFIELPAYILVFASLALIGLGLRKSWLTYTGAYVVFLGTFFTEFVR